MLGRDQAVAGELVEQAVGQLVEVVQAVAQVGVGLADELRARVALDALDRGLGGEAGHHGLAQAAQPAAVVGEHAEGLQHLAVLAGPRHVALLDEAVDRQAQRRDGVLEPRDLGVEVLGDELGHHHARLVQHGVAEPDAVDHAAPRSASGWRSTAGPGSMDWSSPAAIISAISIAVVWRASTSSSE